VNGDLTIARSAAACVAALLVGGAAFAGFSLLKKPPSEKRGDMFRSLITRPLAKETVVPRIREFAVVRSLEDIEIKAQVAGKVVFCGRGTEDGVLVKKGELLMRVEGTDYEIARRQSEAELAILNSDAKRAEVDIKDLEKMLVEMRDDYELEKSNYGRVKSLFDKSVVSKSELEKAEQSVSRRNKFYIEAGNALSKRKFDLEVTRAKIQRAGSALKQAETNLERTFVRSPIDGRVDRCDIETGMYLGVGRTICHVVNDSEPALDVPVNADDALKVLGVRPDKEHWLEAPKGLHVSVKWLRYPKLCAWDAEIAGIEDYDRETDTLKIRVKPTKYRGTDDKPFPLLPGMFCEVVFCGTSLGGVFKIPFSALQFDDNVFTVDSSGVLRRHHVDPFHVEGDEVIILSGLPDGESVVVQQLPRGLVAGMKVKSSSNAADSSEKAGSPRRNADGTE